jgi:hypothetical protein
MKITKQTARRTWIAYTKEEERELGLKIKHGFQEWRSMYDRALRYLMDRGVSLERAVRFVLAKGDRHQRWWRVNALARRFNTGTSRPSIDLGAEHSYRRFAFEGSQA